MAGVEYHPLGKQIMNALVLRVVRAGVVELYQQPVFFLFRQDGVFMQQPVSIFAEALQQGRVMFAKALDRVFLI